MPFRRFRGNRRFKRRRVARPQRRYNTLGAVRFLARKAARGVRYIRGLVNSEMFKRDIAETGADVSTSTYITHFTAVAQGDGDGQRTGNSIFVRNTNCKGVLRWNASAAYVGCTVRIALVMDTQQIGDTSPGWTDVYEAVTPWSHLNSDTVGRFTILASKTFHLNASTNSNAPFFFNKPMRHHVRYNGTASTDVQRGGIYLMAISDIAAASAPPQILYENRLSYHDN